MFFVLKKKSVIVCVCILLVALVAATSIGIIATSGEVSAKRLVPIYSVARDDNKVALTFDCAWGADKTRLIMDEMEKNGYKCTFFVTGFWVDANGELVKEIHSRGHQVANHSENHLHLGSASQSTVDKEIDLTAQKIEALTGEYPKYFRAPFGEYDNGLIKSLNERQTECIQWSVDSLDWKGLSGKEIADRVSNKIKCGDIVLFHNNSDHILDALPIIMLTLKNKNLTAVRVDELVYKDNFVINGEGKQIKNS
ncbi:MAG: polysaccharide deacetylase family protein [Clostridia bacterium]|nr:polysaccharide deacetylase family protein [Clostridia bacterium]